MTEIAYYTMIVAIYIMVVAIIDFLICISFWGFPKRKKSTYEYIYVLLPLIYDSGGEKTDGSIEAVKMMDYKGSEGWQLVGIAPPHGKHRVYYFMREK